MIDIFAALLKELFGGQGAPASQPRRRVRPADGASRRRDRGSTADPEVLPEAQAAQFEEMVRQMLGGVPAEREEAEVEAPPPPPPPPPPPKPPRRRDRSDPERERAATAEKREMPAFADTVEEPKPPPPYHPETPAIEDSLLDQKTLLRKKAAPEFVKRLRGDPQAAREAFVYAEIFGPPIADKREDLF